MSKLVRNSMKWLPVLALALAFFLGSPGLFAAEEPSGPAVKGAHPMDLTTFLDSLKADNQGLPGNQNLLPTPENKIIYCSYQGCPTGQRCWYCHSNWVCIYNYPDPEQVPPGCSGGPV
jgi:hypothetical protein